jgi:hypothetical protein
MAIVYIHYIIFFLCNSILKKLYSLLFNVESGKFLLPLNSWVFVLSVATAGVAVAVAVAVVGGTLRYYQRELALLHSANQQSRDLWTGFKAPLFFSFSISFFFSFFFTRINVWRKVLKLSSKKTKKQKIKIFVSPCYSVALAIVVARYWLSSQHRELQCAHCRPWSQHRKLMAVTTTPRATGHCRSTVSCRPSL